MRIAIVTTSYPRRPGDAAGHFVEAEARALVSQGHEVTVLCPGRVSWRTGNPEVRWLPDAGLFGWPGAIERLREVPSRAVGLPLFASTAAVELARGSFDRVIAHWLVPSGFPIALASRAELEVVAHGSDVRLLSVLPRWLRRAVVLSLRARGARFRFVSTELRERLRADTGLSVPARVEPSPIETSGVPDRARARRRIGLPPDARLVVVVSRLVPSKRVDVALGAATLLPHAELVVVGDGPERRALEQRHPEVRFLGHLSRNDALVWISAADVLLSASRQEGAPTVVREARALGVPVVAAPAGDLSAWAESDADLLVVAG